MFEANPETEIVLVAKILLSKTGGDVQVAAVEMMITMRAFCRLSKMLYGWG